MKRVVKLNYKGIDFDISIRFKKGNETLVFIHGLICSKNDFSSVWEIPSFKKYGILTFDLPGFGKSSKPENFSYDMEDQAEICKLLIEKLGIGDIHLIGHSMGGTISVLLAKKIPDKIISFSNLEGNLIGGDCSLSRKISNMPYGEFVNKKEMIGDNAPSPTYKSSKSLVRWADSENLLNMFLNLSMKKSYFSSDRNVLPCIKLLKDKVNIVTISNSSHFMMGDNPKELYEKLAAVL